MNFDLTNELEKNLPMNNDIIEGYGKGIKELRVGTGQSFWVRNGKVTLGTGSNQIGQEAGVGSWWGAEEFASAPARIGIDGAAFFESIIIKDDSGNTLINSNAVADIVNVINSKLNTDSQQILKDFDFGSVDYAGAVKSGDITWNTSTGAITGGSGTVVYRGGIVGANNGVVKFSISSVTGNAYFAGELAAVTGTFGALTVAQGGYIRSGQTAFDTGTGFWLGNVAGTPKFSIGNSGGNKLTWNGSALYVSGQIIMGAGSTLSADYITVGTLTGRLVRTSSGNQRVELATDDRINFYDGGSLRSSIKYLNNDLIIDSSDDVIFSAEGSQKCGVFGSYFRPINDNAYNLGKSDYRWLDLFTMKVSLNNWTFEEDGSGRLLIKRAGTNYLRIDSSDGDLHLKIGATISYDL